MTLSNPLTIIWAYGSLFKWYIKTLQENFTECYTSVREIFILISNKHLSLNEKLFYDYFVTSFLGCEKSLLSLCGEVGGNLMKRCKLAFRIPFHYYGNNYLSLGLRLKTPYFLLSSIWFETKTAEENMEIKCCWWR